MVMVATVHHDCYSNLPPPLLYWYYANTPVVADGGRVWSGIPTDTLPLQRLPVAKHMGREDKGAARAIPVAMPIGT
jgi:hypothetical protein